MNAGATDSAQLRAELQGLQQALSGEAPPSQLAILATDDLAGLQRMHDCALDNQDHDVPRVRMQRLAELGAVRHTGGGRYCVTAFGLWVLGAWTWLPLETNRDADKRVRAEMASRGALPASPR